MHFIEAVLKLISVLRVNKRLRKTIPTVLTVLLEKTHQL